ncbi:MAG: PilZ domain-containing protein [Candidatus Omnitrophica bacterium]|nr:PilZ domain-containing protein [Candidatus Omnitrophota bacterium]
MPQPSPSERRAHQRVDTHLPLQVSAADFQLATDTKNISCSGVYCQVSRFVPVMTKLSLTLVIPRIVNQRKTEKTIACTGVVVRIHPEQARPEVSAYDIGVFFTDITGPDREVIAGYIQQSFFAGRN